LALLQPPGRVHQVDERLLVLVAESGLLDFVFDAHGGCRNRLQIYVHTFNVATSFATFFILFLPAGLSIQIRQMPYGELSPLILSLMQRFLFSLFVLGALATMPQQVAAQDGGFPVQTTPTTQFVFQNGEVVRRDKGRTTPLTQNVKLRSGVKINYKNGIVEMPADKINPQGKKFTLREGDYVKADGGVVFATPASAAAARGDNTVSANAQYEKYVQSGGMQNVDPVRQMQLLNQKVDLLTQKVNLLSQGRTTMPDMSSIDQQLKSVDAQLAGTNTTK
jgi:hypothetical protein